MQGAAQLSLLEKVYNKEFVDVLKCIERSCSGKSKEKIKVALAIVVSLSKDFKRMNGQMKNKIGTLETPETMLSIIDKLIKLNNIIKHPMMIDCKHNSCKKELVILEKKTSEVSLKSLRELKEKVREARNMTKVFHKALKTLANKKSKKGKSTRKVN